MHKKYFILVVNQCLDDQQNHRWNPAYASVIVYPWYTPGGGARKNFWVQVCAAQVFKSRISRTDFWLGTGGLGNKFLLQFVSQELKFSQNSKNWAWKNAKFFTKIEMVSLDLENGLKWWVSRAKNGLKRGSWGRHIPVLPSNVSALTRGAQESSGILKLIIIISHLYLSNMKMSNKASDY